MPTFTSTCSKQHNVTNAPGNYGNSKDDHAPVGYNSSTGWRYRDLMFFPLAGLPAGARLTKATLKMKTTNGVHLQHGGAPTISIRRVTEGWAGTGGSGETWRSDANPAGFGTSTTTSDEVVWGPGNNDSTVYSKDIIGIVEDQAPSDTFRRNGTPCGGNNNGIELRTPDDSSGYKIEFHSIRGGYAPRLEIEYTLEDDPQQPTLVKPLGNYASAAAADAIEFDFPADDGTTRYSMDFGLTKDDNSLLIVSQSTLGMTGKHVATSYAAHGGDPLPVGVTLHWRVRGWNSTDTGPYAYGTLIIAATPTASVVDPPSGGLAHIHNLGALALWTDAGLHAKPRVTMHYDHPTGMAADRVEIEVGGTVYGFDGAVAANTNVTKDIDKALQRNVTTTLRVRARATDGTWSAWTASQNFKVNWAQGVFAFNHVATASAFTERHAALTGGAKAQVAYLYQNPGAAGWKTAPADVVVGTSMQVLVRLSTSDAAQVPALPSMGMEWQEAPSPGPDHWEASNGVLQQSPDWRRFGIHGMKVTPGGTGYVRNPTPLPVTPGAKYTFSVFVHTGGDVLSVPVQVGLADAAGVEIARAPAGSEGATTASAGKGSDDWQRLFYTFTMPGTPAVAGSGTVNVWPTVYFGGTKPFYLDSAQFESGTVASQWAPGSLGPAVIMDVGGIAVDALAGGIFRLKGSLGGLKDTVNLHEHGLKFGDVEVFGDETKLWGKVQGVTHQLVPPAGGGEGGPGSFSGARVYRSTAQSIPDGGSGTAVIWSGIRYDVDGWWNAANPTRLTAPFDCKVHVDGGVYWVANNSGRRVINLRKTALAGGVVTEFAGQGASPSTSNPWGHATGADIELLAGDYIELFAFQTSGGGSLSIDAAGSDRVYMDIHLIGGIKGDQGIQGPVGATGSQGPAGPAGTTLHSGLTDVTADQHHAKVHALTGSDHTASGLTAGHVMRASGATAFGFAAIQDADLPSTIARDSEVSGAITTHEGAADPHTGYQKESEKGVANGYAALDSGLLVPVAQLGTGTPTGAKFLRDDRTWQVPPGGGGGLTDHTHLAPTTQGGLINELRDGGVVGTNAARIFLAGAVPNGQAYIDIPVGFNIRRPNGTILWSVRNSDGAMYPGADNSFDLGTTSVRPRAIYTRALDVSGTVTGIDAADVGAEAAGAVASHAALPDAHHARAHDHSLAADDNTINPLSVSIDRVMNSTPFKMVYGQHPTGTDVVAMAVDGNMQSPLGSAGFIMGGNSIHQYGGYVGFRKGQSNDAIYMQPGGDELELYVWNDVTQADGTVQPGLKFYSRTTDPATQAGSHTLYAKAGGLYIRDSAGDILGPLGVNRDRVAHALVNINSVTDVTVASMVVPGLVVGDQIVVDLWGIILNNSGATKVYVITLDIGTLFDIEYTTAALNFGSGVGYPFQLRAIFTIVSATEGYHVGSLDISNAGTGSGADVGLSTAAALHGIKWASTTTNLTGSQTVALKARSADATATQSLRVVGGTIRRLAA